MSDFVDFGSLFSTDPADLIGADHESVRDSLLRRIAASMPDWYADAACRGLPAAWFYPGHGQGNERAMQTCGRCTVREACLDYALADPDLDHGIWGGMTGTTRRARRQAEAKRGARRAEA